MNPALPAMPPAAANNADPTVGTSSCTKVINPSVRACVAGIHSWNPSGNHVDGE